MNTEAERRLVESAAQLGRAAPTSWSVFIQAMRAYADAWKTDLMISPADRFQVNQGQTKQADRLAEMFKDALQTSDRAAKKAEERARGQAI